MGSWDIFCHCLLGQNWVFLTRQQRVFLVFKAKTSFLFSINKGVSFLFLNLIRPFAQYCYKMKLNIEPKETFQVSTDRWFEKHKFFNICPGDCVDSCLIDFNDYEFKILPPCK